MNSRSADSTLESATDSREPALSGPTNGVGMIDSAHFIATEFIEGKTLREHMAHPHGHPRGARRDDDDVAGKEIDP